MRFCNTEFYRAAVKLQLFFSVSKFTDLSKQMRFSGRNVLKHVGGISKLGDEVTGIPQRRAGRWRGGQRRQDLPDGR